MLTLLGLLQSRPDWSGPELAQRLGVTDRTVRNDVARLRELGYPVATVRGPGGRYRLGAGAVLPPLLLDDEEAVAIAVGLRTTTGMKGFEDSGGRALSKLEQVMPHRIRRRIEALRMATTAGPVNTDSNIDDPVVEPELLTEIAAAVRDRMTLRCDYEGRTRDVEPYQLVVWQRRWHLVVRDVASGEWAPLRVDWLRLKVPGGRRFSPATPPGDLTEFVVREVAGAGWSVRARIIIDAPPDEVVARINPTVGTVEPLDDGRSVLVTGGDTMEIVAVWISMLGLDFVVQEPPELVEHLAVLADRYARAVEGSRLAASPTTASPVAPS